MNFKWKNVKKNKMMYNKFRQNLRMIKKKLKQMN